MSEIKIFIIMLFYVFKVGLLSRIVSERNYEKSKIKISLK